MLKMLFLDDANNVINRVLFDGHGSHNEEIADAATEAATEVAQQHGGHVVGIDNNPPVISSGQ